MRKLALIALTVALFAPAAVRAAEDDTQISRYSGRVGSSGAFGLGFQVGSPTGITGKYFLDRDLALDFGLDFAQFHAGFGVHADLLWRLTNLVSKPAFDLPFYLGVGAQLASYYRGYGYWDYWGNYTYQTRLGLAVQVPFGIAFWLRRVPLEIFLEIGPRLWVTEFGFNPLDFYTVGGLRYYF